MRFSVAYMFSMSFFRTYVAWLLLPFLAGTFGVLASTANPLLIGMGASSLIGIALLSKPTWNINLVIVLGLFVSGLAVLFYGDSATKLVWGVSILGFMALTSAFYKLLTDSNAIKATPVFVWLAILFFLYAIFDSVFQLYSAKDFVTGFKRYFQMWGLLFALCWTGFSKKQVNNWCLMILGICLLQTPFCLHQLIVLVPERESLVYMYPGMVPIDIVAGSFGGFMYGGSNNAEMATVLIMIFGFLLSRYRANLLTVKQMTWLSIILLMPLGMGETKILVIFFPIMLLTLYRKDMLTRPVYGVVMLLFGCLSTALLINIYMIVTEMTFDQLIFDTMKYNVYEVGYGNFYLNRTTALTFWWKHQSLADPVGFLFGHGLGCANAGDGDKLGGFMDSLYPQYGIGLSGASLLLWELGIVGIVLYELILVAAWQTANRMIKFAVDASIRADAAAIQSAIAMFMLYPFYRDSLFNQVSFQLIFTFFLGYLAWMAKHYVRK